MFTILPTSLTDFFGAASRGIPVEKVLGDGIDTLAGYLDVRRSALLLVPAIDRLRVRVMEDVLARAACALAAHIAQVSGFRRVRLITDRLQGIHSASWWLSRVYLPVVSPEKAIAMLQLVGLIAIRSWCTEISKLTEMSLPSPLIGYLRPA